MSWHRFSPPPGGKLERGAQRFQVAATGREGLGARDWVLPDRKEPLKGICRFSPGGCEFDSRGNEAVRDKLKYR